MKKSMGAKKNTKDIVFNIVVVLFSLYMIIAGICDLITVITWDSGGIIEYEGEYEVKINEIKTQKSYTFQLDNGDKVIFSDKFNYDDHKELKFKYAKLISIVRMFAHRGVGVTTTDDVIIISEQSMKTEILNLGIIGIVLGLVFMSFLILPVVFDKILLLICKLKK